MKAKEVIKILKEKMYQSPKAEGLNHRYVVSKLKPFLFASVKGFSTISTIKKRTFKVTKVKVSDITTTK